jgi:TIR domain
MTSDEEPIAFWSYTHRDNELENGKIRRLADAIANEFELLTGRRLEIFVDSSAIDWGDEWKKVIDNALTRTAFFIPLLTPLYLKSEQCRREFIQFIGRATSVDARDLVLPIYYADASEIAAVETTDEVARLAQDIQWQDWRTLRLADESGREYRVAVNILAKRLADLSERFSDSPLIDPLDSDFDDSLGPMDHIGRAEGSIQRIGPTLTAVQAQVQLISAASTAATEKMVESDKHGGGMRGRLVVLNSFSQEITEPADLINTGGAEFSRLVIDSDPGMQALIRGLLVEELSLEQKAERDELFETIRTTATSAAEMADSLKGFVTSINSVQSMSRVVRTPLQRMRAGLAAIIDGVGVLTGWAELIDQSIADGST